MKVWLVPTIHPAKILRSQTMQYAVVEDLRKACRIQKEGPTLLPMAYREGGEFPYWSHHPSLEDLETWLSNHRHHTLSLDLEVTFTDRLMCMGMWCVDCLWDSQGICAPFMRKGGLAYWGAGEELQAKALCRSMLEDKDWPKIGQNWVGFDELVLKRIWGIEVKGCIGDTMIAHWLCFPELPHGLSFIGSLCTDLGPFKEEVHTSSGTDDDDTAGKWENVEQYDDVNLRTYCMLDAFTAAVEWRRLEEVMKSDDEE